MTTTINGSSPSITFSDGSAQTSATRPFQNRIINGAMVIDQRNAGASISVGSSPVYPVDRFQVRIAQGSGHTAQRSTTVPAGFVNSVLVTVGTGASPTSGQVSIFNQQIEGFNMADLGWGTASAQTVTISFKVRSSVTGTYSVAMSNSGLDRSYVTTFTINAANTFEDKSVTIAGDTSGTWLKDNGIGAFVFFDLGSGTDREAAAGSWGAGWKTRTSGSVQLAATSGATFYITGVQLEVGSTATSFDYRPYGTELALCQRYALKYNTDAIVYAFIGSGYATSTTNANISLPLPVQMRTAPTVTASTLMVQDGTTITAVTATAVVTNQTNSLNAFVQATVASGLTAFRPYQLQTNNSTSGNLLLSAEL